MKPITGETVSSEIMQCIGAFRQLEKAYIISYRMQDAEFSDQVFFSRLISRQTLYGAKITLMTTPPEGKGQSFKDKLKLLDYLERQGVDIYLNEKLHAKAYLFLDDRKINTSIIGSANLTYSGFGLKESIHENLLELALITRDPSLYEETLSLIQKKFIDHQLTIDFSRWKNLIYRKYGLV